MIGAVLLAAGGAVRMRRPKLLLAVEGESLVRRAGEAACASRCRPVVVVLGADAHALAGELAGLRVRPVINPLWRSGLASSIRAGTGSLPRSCEAAVLLLADQPRVGAAEIDRLICAWLRSGRPVAAASYGGTVGAPAVFERALFPALRALRGDAGAKQLLHGLGDRVEKVPLKEGAEDLDTWEQWERFRNSGRPSVLQQSHGPGGACTGRG